jgi:hypothetical protein
MIIKYRINKDGTKCWFKNNQHHRPNNPAIECVNGTKKWFQNGRYHRTDGPAVEWADGRKYWYIDDKYCTEVEHNQLVSK